MIPPFHAMILLATLWLVLLWAAARLRVGRGLRRVSLGFCVAAALLLFVPVQGLRLSTWAFGFWTNPSMLLLGVVCAGLWQRLFRVDVLKPADWTATWAFGAVAGSVLYLHPMIFGSVDLYYWGWERGVAAWGLAAVAIGLLAIGNRLGALLLAALTGFACDALESANCWDYVVDPIFWLLSLGVLAGRAWRGLATRGRESAVGRASARLRAPLVFDRKAG